MKQKVFFKTFGCRTNQFDTQVMINNLKSYEVTLDEEQSDVIVINSCTVTNGADVGVRQYITKMKKRFPDKKFFMTGCGAISQGQKVFDSNNVFGVFGHSLKQDIDVLLNKKTRFFDKGDLNYVDGNIVSEYVGKTKAFIKIQEGCDFECSYCIIPSVRGKSRSLNQENILKQIKLLASNGYGEFVLTGTNTGSYGKDLNSSIAKLIKKISLIQGVKRIRLGSLEPIQINDEFKELLNESFMAKHLHIALQHTSNKMLEIMKRRNRFEDDLKLFEEIASYGYALGTDYILAHPGESEQIFDEGIENFRKLPITHIHPFSYSKRDNTVSANMKEQINGNIAKQRLHFIKSIVAKNNENFRKKIKEENKTLQVLLENSKDNISYGIDQYFNKIQVQNNEGLKNTWVNIQEYEIQENNNYTKNIL